MELLSAILATLASGRHVGRMFMMNRWLRCEHVVSVKSSAVGRVKRSEAHHASAQ